MTTTIRPIETVAFGRRFRSRLEARYAVFLSTLGLRWEYEPEGFELPSGRYLPDFKVHHGRGPGFGWLEVKPALDYLGCHADDDQAPREVVLARELARATNTAVVLAPAEAFDLIRTGFLAVQADRDWMAMFPDSLDVACFRNTGHFGFRAQYSRRPSELDSSGQPKGFDSWSLVCLEGMSLRALYKAANAALSARFEHGEGFA